MNKYLAEGKRVIGVEIEALQRLKDTLDESFIMAVSVISESTGRVVVTGVGKSGHIARKIAATMSSLGTTAFFLHPDDALHGDLGMVYKDDVMIVISNSGESEELIRLLPNVRIIGAKIIAITSNEESNLAKQCDILCKVPKVEEACVLKLAPTSSTTVSLVLGDALAVALSVKYGFDKSNYAVYHPAGALGKKLVTRVADIMHTGEEAPIVLSGENLKTAIIEISKKGHGAVIVVDKNSTMLGIITDGDLRRSMDTDVNIYECTVDEIMTRNPISILRDALAIDVLILLQNSKKKISILPVVDGNTEAIGIITVADILKAGIVC